MSKPRKPRKPSVYDNPEANFVLVGKVVRKGSKADKAADFHYGLPTNAKQVVHEKRMKQKAKSAEAYQKKTAGMPKKKRGRPKKSSSPAVFVY